MSSAGRLPKNYHNKRCNTWMEDKNDKLNKIPAIDLSRCTDCESCIEICPTVFKRNNETGLIEVIELSEYPEEDVHEARSICPTDCITWEEAL